MESSCHIHAVTDDDSAAALSAAGIDGVLYGFGIEGAAVTDGAAASEVIFFHSFCLPFLILSSLFCRLFPPSPYLSAVSVAVQNFNGCSFIVKVNFSPGLIRH